MKKVIQMEEFYELHPTFLFEGIKKIKNSVGGHYEEILKVYQLPDGLYCDRIYKAPWQVGGNSGQVRKIFKLRKEEVFGEMLSYDKFYDANDVEITIFHVYDTLRRL